MHTRAFFRSAIFSVCLASATSFAQQPASATASSRPAEQVPTGRQAAMNLLEEALAGTGSLIVPANRLTIELRAFPILWTRSEARARALVQQMAGEFTQVASASKEDTGSNPQFVFANLRNQRNLVARSIAGSDAELALLFVSSTQSSLNDDPQDRALVSDLAAEVAQHDPRRALQLAEQELKEGGELPQSMINLLQQVQRNGAQAGTQLFRDIVDHLKQQNLSEDPAALMFASALLGSQFALQSEQGEPGKELRVLAETVATSALSSNITQAQPYVLNGAMAALDALVPSKAAALHPTNSAPAAQVPVEMTFWNKLNQANFSGDANQALAALSEAPDNIRLQMTQQTAWNYANQGDLERTGVIADKLEPWERNNVMQQAIRNAAFAAGSRRDFTSARKMAAEITDEESHATLLADLAIFANGNDKPQLAEEMLSEAASLVANRSAGTPAFAAQLHVAQAYLRVKPAQAIPLLERSANQIEQALSAAALLDGFLPNGRSFQGSELILDQSFLYSTLLEPYAQAAAELASLDLPAAQALANRLPLPEARLMTEVFVAAGVLDQKDQTQAASTSPNGIAVFRSVMY
jgi:hypothetical protein